MDEKVEQNKKFDAKIGMVITWDGEGNCFVNMPVNGIPKNQFEDWMKECKKNYSGKRWDKIIADHHKARAYEVMLMTIPEESDLPKESEKNELGLLNGGND